MQADNYQKILDDKIKEKFTELESYIEHYRETLNKEGVWMFLATLGCWSVNDAYAQLFAIAITFLLATYRIFSQLTNKRLFILIVRDLKEMILELESSDTQEARLLNLKEIDEKKLSLISHVKAVPIYLICYTFLLVTIWNWYKVFCPTCLSFVAIP